MNTGLGIDRVGSAAPDKDPFPGDIEMSVGIILGILAVLGGRDAVTSEYDARPIGFSQT